MGADAAQRKRIEMMTEIYMQIGEAICLLGGIALSLITVGGLAFFCILLLQKRDRYLKWRLGNENN